MVAALGALATSCSSGGSAGEVPTADEPATVRIPAPDATGLVVTPEGTILAASRTTGNVVEIDPDTGESYAQVPIPGVDASLAQGGLLGLVVEEDDLVASYTNDEGHLVVAKLFETPLEGPPRWTGPVASEEAIGGRLALLGDGTLLIGVGDLGDPSLADDPSAPNSKILASGSDGSTRPWATGFNNPFAFASDGDTTVWVADNAPGTEPERLLRVTEGTVEVVAEWDETRVPAALAVLEDGRLAICYYATGELAIVDPTEPGDASGTTVADDCAYAVVQLPDGSLAYATETAVGFADLPT